MTHTGTCFQPCEGCRAEFERLRKENEKLLEENGKLRQEAERLQVALARATAKKRRHQQEKRAFKDQARIDPLTGLWNRLAFNELFRREVARMNREKSRGNHDASLSLVLLDVDRFKTINDTRGHVVGDLVLVRLAEILEKSVRETDILARWGGEEFVIALVSTPLDDAVSLMDRVRKVVERDLNIRVRGWWVSATASFGVAQMKEGESIDGFIARADRALYAAKDSGRNRVCRAT